MGLTQGHSIGGREKFFVTPESAFGTYVEASSGDAAKILKSTFNGNDLRIPRNDKRSTRDRLEMIDGKTTVDWSAETYIVPSGSAGTAPDTGDLFEAGLGVETVSGGTSVTYDTSANQTAHQSLSLTRHWEAFGPSSAGEMSQVGGFMEAVRGGVVDETKISGSGGDPPKATFAGRAKDLIHTGNSAVVTGGTPTTSTTVTAGEGENFEQYSVVRIAPAGTAITVTAVSNDTLTHDSVNASAADIINPYTPSETTAGSPIGGCVGTGLAIDSVGLEVLSYEISIKNNFKYFEDEAFQSTITDAIPRDRDITGQFVWRAKRSDLIHLGRIRNSRSVTTDLAFVIGATAGSILTINIDQAELDVSSVDAPEGDEVIITTTLIGLGSSGEDAIELVFT